MKANKQLFDQQDRVKSFHSKLLMCDVLNERDQQLKIKKKKEIAKKHQEKEWNEFEKQKLDEYDDKLREQLEKEYFKKMDNAKVIKDQVHDFKLNYVKKMQEDMIEGELIK